VAARLPRSASRSAGHQRRTDSSGVVAKCAHMSSGLTHATAQARAPCGARYGVRRVHVDQQQLGSSMDVANSAAALSLTLRGAP